jgi:hypothetical protein
MNHDHGNAKAVETADPIVPDCLYAVIGVPSRMDELASISPRLATKPIGRAVKQDSVPWPRGSTEQMGTRKRMQTGCREIEVVPPLTTMSAAEGRLRTPVSRPKKIWKEAGGGFGRWSRAGKESVNRSPRENANRADRDLDS